MRDALLTIENWTGYLAVSLEALLVGRLFWLRLGRAYRWFVSFLICDVLRSVILAVLSESAHAANYPTVWAASEPVYWFTLGAAVLEVFRCVQRCYPNEPHDAHLLLIGFSAGAFLALVVSLFQLDHVSHLGAWQEIMRFVDQVITLMAAAILWVQMGFFSISGKRLPRNLRWHRLIFTLVASIAGIAAFMTSIHTVLFALVANVVFEVSLCVAVLAWLTGFRRKGEALPAGVMMSQAEIEQAALDYEKNVKPFLRNGPDGNSDMQRSSLPAVRDRISY